MPHLAVARIAKSYDGNPAVRDISFEVAAGRVLALCGENGAGKSTLMKMLSGATRPDSGEILLDGKVVAIASPADAMALGIRTVYQEQSLLPHLSVAENMLLGRMPTRGFSFIVDWPEANRIAARVLADFGFPEIDPGALVGSLGVARQQIVEIAKALVAEPKILILDEPTAVISAAEAAKLFDKVRSLAAAGTTVLYISHRLEEIHAIADEIVVLKDGRSVLSGPVAELDQERLIHAMVGRPLSQIFPERKGEAGKPVLEVERLSLGDIFEDVSFTRARRRDRRHVRPGRQRPHRDRQGDFRGNACRRRLGAAERCLRRFRHAVAGSSRPRRHADRGPQGRRAGARRQRHRQCGAGELCPLRTERHHRRSETPATGRRQDPRTVDPACRSCAAGAPAFRRQPAKSRAGEMAAGREHPAFHLR